MISSRVRLIAPSATVASLAEMQLHLKLDTEGSPPAHPDDTLVMDKLAGAVSEIDAGDGWLGRALLPQQWRVSWRGFPCLTARNPDAALVLPFPPLISVDSVKYRDTGGTLITMTEAVDFEVNLQGEPNGFVAPLYRQVWPVTADRFDAVQVVFHCGYDATGSPPNALPEAIKHYCMVAAGLKYSNRDAEATNNGLDPLDPFRNAIQTFRVFGP